MEIIFVSVSLSAAGASSWSWWQTTVYCVINNCVCDNISGFGIYLQSYKYGIWQLIDLLFGKRPLCHPRFANGVFWRKNIWQGWKKGDLFLKYLSFVIKCTEGVFRACLVACCCVLERCHIGHIVHTHANFHIVQQLFQSIEVNISEAGASNQPRDSTHTCTNFNVICTCGSH